ncbi:3-oxoacyl-ACP synthase [Kitasatospora sp. MMS16-BH015]|uniref:beta-ketoacyl-ACP synthase 3 n=1 Tax=Kitasatospora sp. MMS16-BH015 TaxID=2018025 RepID=UPI000CA1CBC8|nr:beta-ketoacyl-ACP synthase 3 [Kitasatospora sp. MMS16-BH015]AUG75080.1 3-oxoacyl-ACP synthase [Kitasatospora sp. MMS16-BH015]
MDTPPHTAARGGRTAVIRGLGASLPPEVVSNEEVIARGGLDTTDEWVRSRTGIRRRRRAAPGVSTGELAVAAASAALRSAPGHRPDLLLLATTTPDRRCPATAPEVAHRLGLGPIPAFDLSAVCSGFLYGLITAAALVRAGVAAAPLVVAAEKYSTIIDPSDRDTAALFGDGAGAVLLTAGDPDGPGAVRQVDWGSDGGAADLIAIASGGARAPYPAPAPAPSGPRFTTLAAGVAAARESPPPRVERYFRMHGRQVYAQAVLRMTESARSVLGATGWPGSEVEVFVGHQANQRILDAVADRLALREAARFGNIGEVGNTAGASIPLVLAEIAEAGAARPGARTLLTAFGGGLTWASVTLNWPDTTGHTLIPHPRPPAD